MIYTERNKFTVAWNYEYKEKTKVLSFVANPVVIYIDRNHHNIRNKMELMDLELKSLDHVN